MAKILAMISIEQKTSYDIAIEVSVRVRCMRKRRGFTQAEMAQRAGMSLASYKRFEQKGLISLQSLINLSIALGCEEDFDALFIHKTYESIQEVIDEYEQAHK